MPDTSYHGWTKPTVDASEDEWGEILNALLDEADLDVIKKGPTSGTPPMPTEDPGTEGRWYLGTDTTDPTDAQTSLPFLFYDDGNAWVTIWDGDAKTLGGNEADTFLSTGETINADQLQGNTPSDFASASHSHSSDDLPDATAYKDESSNFTAGLLSGNRDVVVSDGSERVIRSGTSAPSDATGSDGDIFIVHD
ncbi:hypothetical protein ACFPYI_01865 [Halomarina salina]|uniref:Uncharacterized protein n=1 Tax=Halomarina salina TaxID=1872699 RepID=A0ABD5RI99_9EURY|nr:hypothetical protein [Halomarina salina]